MRSGRGWLALLLLLGTPTTHAHDPRPSYVQIDQVGSNAFNVTWKVPASIPPRALPFPVLPEGCESGRQPLWQKDGGGYLGQQLFTCRHGLSGRVVGIEYPVINPSLSTLYSIRLASGETHLRVLEPGEIRWKVPPAEERFAVATQYTGLGIEHIWLGTDHLLFVACLLFIARAPRRLLITITGFTLAHSLTLALAALDVVRLPTPPVEAAIALSVVFMAWETLKRDDSSLAHRYPALVSSSFGLLHGLGFAAVLHDIGMPQTELPTALLFFNVGVEIGQVLFVLALLGAFAALRPVLTRMLPGVKAGVHWTSLTAPASYAIGGTSAYWVIQRVAGFFG